MEHRRLDFVLVKDDFPPKESGYITTIPPLGLPRNITGLIIITDSPTMIAHVRFIQWAQKKS